MQMDMLYWLVCEAAILLDELLGKKGGIHTDSSSSLWVQKKRSKSRKGKKRFETSSGSRTRKTLGMRTFIQGDLISKFNEL